MVILHFINKENFFFYALGKRRRSLLEHGASFIPDSFDILSFSQLHQIPTELVSISADGKQRRTPTKKERSEAEKTKQIRQQVARGGQALQARRFAFIFQPN